MPEKRYNLNAAQAAIRAGYSEKTARFIASENVAKPNTRRLLLPFLREIKGSQTDFGLLFGHSVRGKPQYLGHWMTWATRRI